MDHTDWLRQKYLDRNFGLDSGSFHLSEEIQNFTVTGIVTTVISVSFIMLCYCLLRCYSFSLFPIKFSFEYSFIVIFGLKQNFSVVVFLIEHLGSEVFSAMFSRAKIGGLNLA